MSYNEWLIEAARPEDLAQIVAVINAATVTATPRALIDSQGRLRLARYVPASASWAVARSAAGVIGCAYLFNREPHLINEIGGFVDPAYRDQGVGSALLAWAEQQAQALLPLAAPNTRVVIQSHAFEPDRFGQALLTAAGYQPVRTWLHMAMDLPALLPSVEIPTGVTIRPMDMNNDWPLVGPALDQAFLDHWGTIKPDPSNAEQPADDDQQAEDDQESQAEEEDEEDDLFSNTPGTCFVALANDHVIGSCLCNARTVEWPDTARLGSISVLQAQRQRGVGRALALSALHALAARGVQRVMLDTDEASFTNSNRLYSALGFRTFRREHLFERIVRDGEERRTLQPDPS